MKVTDRLDAFTLPKRKGGKDHDSLGEFVTIRAAQAGEVFRGVALAPEDHAGDDE